MSKGAENLRRILQDPVLFNQYILGGYSWSKQQEGLRAIRDHQRVAIRAGRGVGKTNMAAVAVIWFLLRYSSLDSPARVITTAPTWRQVQELLWVEINRIYAPAQKYFPAKLNKTWLEYIDGSYASGNSTNNPESFQGHHAPNFLFVADEASGIDDYIYTTAEGYLTSSNAHMLLIGNPNRIGGQFYRAFTSEADKWHTLHISCLDAPSFTGEDCPDHVKKALVSKQWVEDRLALWGEHSSNADIHIFGNFPRGKSLSAVELITAESAAMRGKAFTLADVKALPVVDEAAISVDVARFGNDRSIIAIKKDNTEAIVKSLATNTIPKLVEEISTIRKDYFPASWRVKVIIDDVGVGGGVTDLLKKQQSDLNIKIVAFQGQSPASRPEYANLRTQSYFEFNRDLPNLNLVNIDDSGVADLCSTEYLYDHQDRQKLESKDAVRKKLGRSPDIADALTMFHGGSGVSIVRAGSADILANSLVELTPADINTEAGNLRESLSGKYLISDRRRERLNNMRRSPW